MVDMHINEFTGNGGSLLPIDGCARFPSLCKRRRAENGIVYFSDTELSKVIEENGLTSWVTGKKLNVRSSRASLHSSV